MQTELFLQARQGDSEALQHLFYQYRPLIYSIKSKYFLRDFDEQDWLQEGLIMFHECLQRFEEEFGTTLGALFKKSFENRIRSFVRKECAYKRKSNLQAISLEQKFFQDGSEYFNEQLAADSPLEQIIIEETLAECRELLSDLEKAAFSRYALGDERPLAQSPQTLRSAYDRSKRKITQYILEC